MTSEPNPYVFSRRAVVGMGLAGAVAWLGGACGGPTDPSANDGRLTARPGTPGGNSAPPAGLSGLNLGGARDGVVFMPADYSAASPAPLMVVLHGAGGLGGQVISRFTDAAEASGVVLLAPDARGSTWDIITVGGFSHDVVFINRALESLFSRVAIDPARVALGGFSDGGSYALSLGLTNGDLFTRVLAYSPGFMSPGERRGHPPIFIAHGTLDQVLPIDLTSRVLVPQLNDLGYAVRYREFEGGHTVTNALAAEGVSWLAGEAPVP